MKTLEEVLGLLQDRIDRALLEEYIAREWILPQGDPKNWLFEDIDIARLELVFHLTQEIKVNDEGMDVVLSLLDQLYGLRKHMKYLAHAILQQPQEVQARIREFVVRLPEA